LSDSCRLFRCCIKSADWRSDREAEDGLSPHDAVYVRSQKDLDRLLKQWTDEEDEDS
jgi:hypothetical protein